MASVRQPKSVRVVAVAVDKTFVDLTARKSVKEFRDELLAAWRDGKGAQLSLSFLDFEQGGTIGDIRKKTCGIDGRSHPNWKSSLDIASSNGVFVLKFDAFGPCSPNVCNDGERSSSPYNPVVDGLCLNVEIPDRKGDVVVGGRFLHEAGKFIFIVVSR